MWAKFLSAHQFMTWTAGSTAGSEAKTEFWSTRERFRHRSDRRFSPGRTRAFISITELIRSVSPERSPVTSYIYGFGKEEVPSLSNWPGTAFHSGDAI